MTSLKQFIDEIDRLTPIPAVTHQILAALDKPGSSIADIVSIIQYDPVITATVLKTCNSAFYGLKNPAESIKDAVAMLGTDKIVELALARSGAQALSGKQKGYGLEEGEMWKYSISSAVIAKNIAQRVQLKNKHAIFTSALLKDIGKLILEKYVDKESRKITDLVKNKGFSFREAEKKIFGIDHAELGAMVAKQWKFSPQMIKIIRHHHLSDEKMIRDKAIAIVYLADCICMMIGMGVGSDGLAYRFKEQVIKDLKMTASDISLIIADFGMKMKDIEQMLALDEPING